MTTTRSRRTADALALVVNHLADTAWAAPWLRDEPQLEVAWRIEVSEATGAVSTSVVVVEPRQATKRSSACMSSNGPPEECEVPSHDHWTTASDWANGHEEPLPSHARYVRQHRQLCIPMACSDCGRPSFYDTEADEYRHVDPAASCFMIPARASA